MSTEGLIRQGALSNLRLKKGGLGNKAETLIKSIKHIFSTSSITPISDIDIEGAKLLMDDLMDIKTLYMETIDKMHKLEKELE